jgi:integrase
MAVAKLTKRVVDRLSQGGLVWDTEVKGLGVRCQTTEAKHYILRYPIASATKTRQRIMSIGRHGSPLTPELARKEANRLKGLIASGIDPLQERKRVREEHKRPAEANIGDQIERYLNHKRGSLKPGSFDQDQRRLKKHAEPIHPLRLSDIDNDPRAARRAIAQLLDDIESGSGPVARNRTRTTLHTFFDWLVKKGLLDQNPVTNTPLATEAGSRERVLSNAEITELWAALGDDRFSNIVRLLLLTGQRRNEIGKLRWSEVDFDRAMLVLPPDRVKNGRQHELPLSNQALAILKGLAQGPKHNRTNDAFVFGRFGGWSNEKAALDRAILASRDGKPIPHWTLHDLRRTCATGMAELGVLPHIIEAILNHISGHKGGVAGVYNRARYEGEMREALVKWGNYVEGLDTTGATVTRISA